MRVPGSRRLTGCRRTVVLLALILLSGYAPLRAQSLADDITQLTLDYEKLAQMKQILTDMYNAYTIIYKGYEDVKSISQGNFNLHKAFLDALLAVSPAVSNYYKIANIINNEATLVKEYQSANSYFQKNGYFSSAELNYLSTVYTNLFNGSLRDIEELTMVITAGQLRMSDAERLAAIDRVDKDMTDKLSFLRTFNNNGVIQGGQRGVEQNDINFFKTEYGLQ